MLKVCLPSALLALVAFAGAAPAATFTFSGACLDCQGTATATLVLNNAYVPGTALATSDLVSFNYHGTNLLPAFAINAGDPLVFMTGNIPAALPAFADFHIEGEFPFLPAAVSGYSTSEILPRFTFDTWANGSWSAFDANRNACSSITCDFGDNGTWNPVPEPGAFLLVAGGLAALGIRRWKLQA